MRKHLAMIGDIVDSRGLDNREAVQLRLEQVLAEINVRFANAIRSKFLSTVGDEFQGLLVPSSEAFTIINTVLDKMHPVEFRFGLGYGEITTPLQETAIGMAGPAFYGARQALDYLKNSKEISARLRGPDLDKARVRAINAIFSSLSIIRQFWPDNFKAILPSLRTDLTQQEIARIARVTQSAVSSRLHRAKWRQVKAIEGELIYMLDATFYNL